MGDDLYFFLPLPGGGRMIFGTDEADIIEGTLKNDIIFGLAGGDFVAGDVLEDFILQYADDYSGHSEVIVYGNDSIEGGGGNDILSGDYALLTSNFPEDMPEDNVVGEPGELKTVYGHDLLAGGWGDDQIAGDYLIQYTPLLVVIEIGDICFGNDTILGEAGDDILSGDSLPALTDRDGETPPPMNSAVGSSVIHYGDDHVWGGRGNDTVVGDALELVSIFVQAPPDLQPISRELPEIHADEFGNDRLYGQQGDDLMVGDLLVRTVVIIDDVTPAADRPAEIVDPGGAGLAIFGNDVMYGGSGADFMVGDILEPLRLLDNFENAEQPQGLLQDELEPYEFGNDRMFGNGGADMISGDDGRVISFFGIEEEEEPLDAPSGALAPDSGNGVPPGEILIGFSTEIDNLIVWEGWRPGGNDYASGGSAGDVIAGDGGNDHLLGGGGADYLLGGPGMDKLAGGGGRDLIDGGLGPDKMFGGTGRDTFLLKQGEIEADEIVEDGPDAAVADEHSDPLHGFNGDKILDYNKFQDTIVFVFAPLQLDFAAADAPQEAPASEPVVYIESLGLGFFEVFFDSDPVPPPAADAPEQTTFNDLEGERFFVLGAHDVDDLKIEVIGGTLVEIDDAYL